MILVDFSSILHRMIYSSISSVNPSKRENGKFETSEYINFTKHLILSDLLSVNHEHGRRFGVLVICLDNHSGRIGERIFILIINLKENQIEKNLK